LWFLIKLIIELQKLPLWLSGFAAQKDPVGEKSLEEVQVALSIK
jgi:hypothetical protein